MALLTLLACACKRDHRSSASYAHIRLRHDRTHYHQHLAVVSLCSRRHTLTHAPPVTPITESASPPDARPHKNCSRSRPDTTETATDRSGHSVRPVPCVYCAAFSAPPMLLLPLPLFPCRAAVCVASFRGTPPTTDSARVRRARERRSHVSRRARRSAAVRLQLSDRSGGAR